MDMDQLASDIQQGGRRALAKAITLLESTRPSDRLAANDLLLKLRPQNKTSIRLGISGVPGAGKSTFIETLGINLVKNHGMKVAVLAIDPSSPVSGGSLLGDKTRMESLSQLDDAFIRPSPTKGFMGGINTSTRESMLLCEAAGFDIVIIETVGVGQSEYQVRELVDAFLLLAVPNTGDELQGIKKGIMELADVIAVNKADVDPKAADLAKIQMESALTMVTSSSLWSPRVLTNNALSKDSVEMVWSVLQEYLSSIRANGDLEKLREKQNLIWLKEKVQTLMMDSIKSSESYVMLMQQAQLKVQKKSQHVVEAASELVGEWMKI
ncbi:MAG: methylmalonyl Co-A mutase-associated GTPase MeaB [Bdellovibrionaceae bacterium]|nr:methylmalonyl Co-A mutase-associated GTPase MeaB [Pseudobdellovibrionaceae bacterium]|tara:strand:- start:157187 stop:158158 length:972 start_codon:yes stop_codon:yes gene_type:complete